MVQASDDTLGQSAGVMLGSEVTTRHSGIGEFQFHHPLRHSRRVFKLVQKLLESVNSIVSFTDTAIEFAPLELVSGIFRSEDCRINGS